MVRFGYVGPRTPTPEVVEDLFSHRWPRLAVDIETRSLRDRTIIGVGVAPNSQESWYFPLVGEFDPDLCFRVWELLGSPHVTKVLHNAAFDLGELEEFGVDSTNIIDTSTMAWHLGLPAVLGELHYWLCGEQLESAGEFLKRLGCRTMDQAPLAEVAKKCTNDCMATMAVLEKMEPHLDWFHFGRDMRLLPLLFRMGRLGVRIDQEERGRIESELEREAEFYRGLCEAEGFNPGSPQQVGYILQLRGNHLPFKRGYTGVETGEEFLEVLTDPLAAVVLNYRRATKLLGTYLRPWAPPVSRGYTRYHLNTVTSRTASADRNFQNIPVKLRTMFLPDEGEEWFTELDFAQQEYRALAWMSQDPEFDRIFREGLDIHQETADFMGIDRKTAKNVGYAMTYGGDDQTLAATAHITDTRLGAQLRRDWRARFRKAADWIDRQGQAGLKEGKVHTLQGRVLYLPARGTVPDDDIARKAVNYPVQGSAAEVMKDALLRTEPLDPRITVHDSLVFPGIVPEPVLKKDFGLESLREYKTAIKVEYKRSWGGRAYSWEDLHNGHNHL